MMYDLNILRDKGKFSLSSSAPTRLAMIHRSFRSSAMRKRISRQRFAAHFPALGLLNLAHSLRVDAANGLLTLPEIRYFDDEAYEGEDELVEAVTLWLGDCERRVIAASAYTSTIDDLESFLSKFDATGYLLLVGGAHATLAPDIRYTHIVVRGEGSAALRHILCNLFTPDFGHGPDATGICYCLDGKEVVQKQAFDRSLEVLPSPGFAYDLLPDSEKNAPIYATNFTRMLGQHPQIYICTQSCRARCTFCSTYLIHGKTRARPIDRIRDDLHYLIYEQGHDSLEFHDDDLLQHPDFFDLLEVLKELQVPWFCYARVDLIVDEVANRMADAGCQRVFLGLESMRQEKLDYFNKSSSVEQNKRAVHALAAAGIGAVIGFIIGAPDDTVESILLELDAFLGLPIFAINCSILSPDPGTVEFYRARKKSDDFLTVFGGKGDQLRVMPNPDLHGVEAPMGLPSVCEMISKPDLNRLLKLIDAEFYFRPEIWQRLTAGRSREQVDLIRAYYFFLFEGLSDVASSQLHTPIVEREHKLFQRMQEKFWEKKVLKSSIDTQKRDLHDEH